MFLKAFYPFVIAIYIWWQQINLFNKFTTIIDRSRLRVKLYSLKLRIYTHYFKMSGVIRQLIVKLKNTQSFFVPLFKLLPS